MDVNALYDVAIKDATNGENALFALLSARFRLILRHRVANPQDVEDIVQESLAVIHAEYRSLEVHSSFAAWAHAVLKNRLLAYYDRKAAASARTAPVDERSDIPSTSDAQRLESLRTRLLSCLRKIGRANVRYARVINLHHQGYETQEICGRLSISTTNFYSILSRARDMLESCLEEKS